MDFKGLMTKNGKFLGGVIPLDLFNYLNLYSLAKGESRSCILRSVMDRWRKKSESPEKLITLIALRIQKQWDKVKENKDTNFESFVTEARAELTRMRNIHSEFIDLIIKKLKE